MAKIPIHSDPNTANRIKEAYEDAERELEEFLAINSELLEQLRTLVTKRNSALHECENQARSLGNTLGPVEKGKPTARVNPERALAKLGPDRFAEIGGTMETHASLDIAKARQAVKAGQIEQQEFDEFTTTSWTFKVPPSFNVP